jgi:hypothetical protein
MAAATPAGAGAGSAGQRQRTLIIGAAGLVLLLVFFFIIRPLLFNSGGGGSTPSSLPPLARPRVTTTTTLAPGSAPAETFEVFRGKNPFLPLVNPAGTGGTAETTVGGGGTTGTTPAGSTGTTVPSGTSGGAATEPRASQRVALINVYQSGGKTVADVRVNDTVFTKLAPGDTFATNYKVVSLSGQCGTFLFGDERFQLCEGEEVLK